MSKEKRAVAAGHICIDITPVFGDKKFRKLEEVLIPGKVIQTQGVNIHTGGAVANTGLAMKQMGIDVSLMGKVGNDEFGSLILKYLAEYDADAGVIIAEDSETSYSVVLSVPGIDRLFLHNPGANDTFSFHDLDYSVIEAATLFHFGYPTIMKRMYQDEGDEFLRILKKVKELGTAVSLDMAAIDPAAEAADADWEKILEKALPDVDFFVPSVEELCFMLDRERYEAWVQKADGGDVADILSIEDIKLLGEKVMGMGAKVVLIKCGALGMYYRTGSKEQMSGLCDILNLSVETWAGKEGFEASYEPEAVVSGTGAGDVSIAAFLAAVLQEEPLEDAVHLAAAAGACCVASHDALSGLKSLAELKDKIAGGWAKRMG